MLTQYRVSIVRVLAILLILAAVFAPLASDPAPVFAQEGESGAVEEEAAAEGEVTVLAGSGAGAAVTLAIIGLVLVLVAVVSIIGAVSLGIIGIGYWSVSNGE